MRNYIKLGQMPKEFERVFQVMFEERFPLDLMMKIYDAQFHNNKFWLENNRLRQCMFCGTPYWQQRLNSLTCGKSKCIDGLQNDKKKAARNER